MNISSKRLVFSIAAAFVCVFSLLLLLDNSEKVPLQIASPPKQSVISAPTHLISQKRLRNREKYDMQPSKDRLARYYQQREQMIRTYHGDTQVDNVLNGLRSGKDLLKWLGRVQSHEVVNALPLVTQMLENSDEAVRKVAAETLCWFGEKRGFDFILDQRKQPDGLEWASSFQKVFVEYQPRGYNEALVKLMMEKNGEKTSQKVDAYAIAEVLAAMGDPASLDVILPVLSQYPPDSAEAILLLGNVDDPRILQLAKDLLQHGRNSKVKQAAEIILAAYGDESAQQNLVAIVGRLVELPQPRNADGNYKSGMAPKAIGAPNPAWDDEAVLVLERGMEYVPSARAVPMLKHIAINAKNVRFSETSIQVLAKIGDDAAREALWETARALPSGSREFEITIYTALGKALLLFKDETSRNLALKLFGADNHGIEAYQLFAESKGWNGLFKQNLFY